MVALLFAGWLLREAPFLPPQSQNFQSSQGSVEATSSIEYERWELKSGTVDVRSYAKQLDCFEIELGCVGGGLTTVDTECDFSSGDKED